MPEYCQQFPKKKLFSISGVRRNKTIKINCFNFGFLFSFQGKNSLLKSRKLVEKRKTLTLHKNSEYQNTVHKISFCGYVQVSSSQGKQSIYFINILHIHFNEVIISSTLIADAEIK